MSRLDELINELCPNGVEYKPMGELGNFFGGITGKSKDDFKDGNSIFISYKNVYDNPAIDIDPSDRVKIAKGEKQRTLQYGDVIFTGSSETPDECGISSVVTEYPNEKLYLNSFCFFFRFNDLELFLPGFTKHLFRSSELRHQIGKTASGVTRFNVSKDKMKKVKIPVPPLEVQREIVRILDEYTEKNEALQAELTAEITARNKQYEHYMVSLLSFEDCDVEWRTIEEVFDVKNGYTPSKKIPEYWENGKIPWFRTEDIRTGGRVLHDSIQHINISGIKKGGLFKKDSIIISTTATLGEHAIIKTDFMCNQQLTCMTIKDENKEKVLPDFAFYYCFIIDKLCESVANQGGGIPIVDQKRFRKLLFPIPPLQRQKSIVDLLTQFDKLNNEITDALPVEIETRQKQYEYYRDKLFSFNELS